MDKYIQTKDGVFKVLRSTPDYIVLEDGTQLPSERPEGWKYVRKPAGKSLYHRAYYAENKEAIIQSRKESVESMRKRILDSLGGKCSNCHETEQRTLHIINAAKRGVLGYYSYWKMLERTIIMEKPHEMYLLCLNCMAKEGGDEA
jgi:hypothetical protein